MKYFALLDSNGQPTSFYNEEVHRTYITERKVTPILDAEGQPALDDEGRPLSEVEFVTSLVDDLIPADAVEITKEQWQEFLDNPRRRKLLDGQVIECELVIVPPTWQDIRQRRDALLSVCDWTMLPDSPLTTEKRHEWVVYRQTLRHLTVAFDAPEDVIWPQEPSA